MGRDRLHVVGDRAEAHHHVVGVVAHVGQDRRIFAAGQRAVFLHHLAGDVRHFADEMGAVVDGAGLEVGLVLHAAGDAGVVDVDQRRNELARALLVGVQPLAPPLAPQFLGHEGERVADQRAGRVGLDRRLVGGQEIAQIPHGLRREFVGDPHQILAKLEGAALGAEQHVLRHRRALDPARRIAKEFAQELGLGHARFRQHVAGGEAVHGVGDRDQRQRAEAIGDRGEVGRLLRIAAEQYGVAGLEQRVDVVMTRHDVERVLGDDARRDLQHETADLLADGDVVRLHPVQDALAGGGVGDVFASGQRRPEGAALGRMLAFRLEEEGVLAPDVDSAIGSERLINFRDLGGRGDRVADHAAAYAAHNFRYSAIAIDDALNAWKFCSHVFPEDRRFASSPRRSFFPLIKGRRRLARQSGSGGNRPTVLISRARVRTPVSSSFSLWSSCFVPRERIASF